MVLKHTKIWSSNTQEYGTEAQTPVDRQGVCRCIKNAIGGVSFSSNNLNNAQSLPAKCGVNLPYSISPSTNCDR